MESAGYYRELKQLQCEDPHRFAPCWYAIYTRPRHEKKVAWELERRNLQVCLPTYETIRRWKNGRHRLQLPLFPGYAFVRISLGSHLAVLKVPGVVRLVGFNGRPMPLPDPEVESIRQAVNNRYPVEPYPYLGIGRKVRIKSGPLAGSAGILVRRAGQSRLIISLELIMRSIAVNVEADNVEAA
jgi:transcription antitermination factor NusG